jgi:hypothetical protein
MRPKTGKVTGADESPAMTCAAGRHPVDRRVRRHDGYQSSAVPLARPAQSP